MATDPNTSPNPSNIIELVKCKPSEFADRHQNATEASLLDELKTTRNAETIAKGQAGLLKTMLFARATPQILGTEKDHNRVLKSETNTATCKWVIQRRFDTDSFANDYPDLFKKYQKTVEFIQLTFDKET